MDCFEDMLAAERGNIERFVRFRLNAKADADDCLQEIYLAAYRSFGQLKDKSAFKAWLVSIARNKCKDYFQRKAKRMEISIDTIAEMAAADSRYGITETDVVRETLDLMRDKDKQILYLYFWKELPQAEIARKLQIPLGTVKSRLHTAKQNFKSIYPCRTDSPSEEVPGKKLPALLPAYDITESRETAFSVKREELAWFLVPKPGEKLSWGMYDLPSRRCSHVYDMAVTGKARIHGIEGMELNARETSCSNPAKVAEHTFVAQLTDTHCRYLAAMRTEGDVRHYLTFLDSDAFLPAWGFGQDNCGTEINLWPKGDIRRNGQVITCARKDFLLDIVGRYTVIIGRKSYDTVCAIEIGTYESGILTELFLDKHGRTILSRRFNRDDWAIARYGKRWAELLPENETLEVNGEIYVHWYDCITDYIL